MSPKSKNKWCDIESATSGRGEGSSLLLTTTVTMDHQMATEDTNQTDKQAANYGGYQAKPRSDVQYLCAGAPKVFQGSGSASQDL